MVVIGIYRKSLLVYQLRTGTLFRLPEQRFLGVSHGNGALSMNGGGPKAKVLKLSRRIQASVEARYPRLEALRPTWSSGALGCFLYPGRKGTPLRRHGHSLLAQKNSHPKTIDNYD